MEELTEQFHNPGVAWRGKPFWSWNGELDEAELIRQIHVMKEMGLGGFFMHSRSGLITEYLSEEWFRLTNACADEAQKLGLEAWLYDEDRWPSGTAGGMVTQAPQRRLTYMSLRPVPGEEFAWDKSSVAAFACDLDGVSYTNCVRLGAETPAAVYQNKTVLVFTLEEMAESSFYNGQTYVDTMSLAATEAFIALTHERYKAHSGKRLGASIRGIFTDEPHRGAVFTGFSLDNANRLWMTPWTPALPTRFREQFGADIIGLLPELFLCLDGDPVSPVKWQYMELIQQMFLANFAKPLYDWCEQNGMRLTGHALHEDSLTAQAAMLGSLMRFYEYQHDPGVDVLTESSRHVPIIKQLASAARQLGKRWLLSELYGCTGWQMNFRSHKEVGDWQALFGINLRCHHLSWYTMEGEAKRDYPASILHQSAWWRDYAYVETYFARLGLLLSQGEPCCDILVLNPIESVWCQIHVGWAEGLTPKTTAIQDLESSYAELSSWLLNAHLDFDYGDEEMMSRLSRVGPSASKDGPLAPNNGGTGEDTVLSSPAPQNWGGGASLIVGHAQYRVVVVGRHTTLRSSTLRLLDEFHQTGGTVLFVGPPPAFIDARPSDMPQTLAALCHQLPWAEDALVDACRRHVQTGVEIRRPDTGEALQEISCQLRADGDSRLLVAVNRSDNQQFTNAVIRIQGRGEIEEWDCRTGERCAVPSRADGEWVEFIANFAPSGERAFRLTPSRADALPTRPHTVFTAQTACDGPFDYALSEDNVCVLDFARVRLGDGDWHPRREILQVDQAVRQMLALPLRGGEMVQPWFRRKHEPAPPVLAPATLAFNWNLDALPDGPVFLALERAADWRITLNDRPVPSEVTGWWVDKAFQKVLLPTAFLHSGPNELTLQIPFTESVNIEAVYLLGAFGVRLDGSRPTLTRLPNQLQIGDLAAQGLPFYGGAVTYQIPLPAAIPPGAPLRLATPSFEAACLKIHANSAPPHIIAWPPFEADLPAPDGPLALELVLTRRNTFGPLHQVPLRAGAYGPHNFLTTGPHFSEGYMLYPAGLLAPPTLSWT